MSVSALPTIDLSGFGGYRHARQAYARPEGFDDLASLVAKGAGSTVIARGKGMSYGDAALNSKGAVLSMERMDRFLAFDPGNAILRAEAGVLVIDAMRLVLPHGLTLAAVPGISSISLGGCAAFDIHSKNHWHKGGFGDWVRSMRVLLSSGELVECSREVRPDLFFATIGGLGMTGIIVDLTIELDRLRSQAILSHAERGNDLVDVFDQFEECLPAAEYAVAWLDLLNAVSGILLTANASEPPSAFSSKSWTDRKSLPVGLISPLFNRTSNRLFNVAFSAKHRLTKQSEVALRPFLFPWDSIPDWNRLYGRRGFVEYQCCIPRDAARAGISAVIGRLLKARSEHPVYFAALKRMRKGVGMLSFPLDGYSLLLDLPVKDGLWPLLDELDAIVAAHGGRVYLAKDGRLSATAFAAMYTDRDRWCQVRAVLDPAERFASDMSRRLGLTGG